MSNIPVFLASDDNYGPFVATTIASICDNTNSFVDFYILDGGISQETKQTILKVKEKFENFSIEFISIDLEKEFKGFYTSTYITLASYSRFLIPQLKQNLDKVLYIDVDVVVMGDIKELFEQDLEKYTIGAVIEQGDIDYVNKSKSNLEMKDESIYFNAGILLINSKKWRDDNIFAKLSDVVMKYNEKLLCHDQDALNKFFEGNYKLLDRKFNVMDTHDEIIIRHFASTIKPWNIPLSEEFPALKHSNEFQKYARMLNLDLSKYELTLMKLKLLDMWKNKKLAMNNQSR